MPPVAGATALRLTAVRPPDAVLFGLGLPDMGGVDVIKGLQGWTRAPVPVLSARRSSGEEVPALDACADGHITEPFSMDEPRAAVRRTEDLPSVPETTPVETDDFTVDLLAKKVIRGGRDVRLTPAEWNLLKILVTRPGRLVPQKHLLQEVRGLSRNGRTDCLRVCTAQLRRKREKGPFHPAV